VTVRALLRLDRPRETPPRWALLVFAASPVSLLVSGFHGNVDSVMAMALVLAVIAVQDDRPVASAGWFALAANVKVAALLLGPLVLAIWIHRGRWRSFAPAAAGMTVLGWLPALLTAPQEFVDQVLGYSSRWGTWGITWLARRFGGEAMQNLPTFGALTPQQSVVVGGLKVLILLATVALAWRGREAVGPDLWRWAALTWGVFFALAPGVGAQYLVWIAPFVLLASARAFAVVTASSTVALVAFYGVTSQWRFDFAHSTILVEDTWLPWTLLPWVCIVAFVVDELRRSSPPT